MAIAPLQLPSSAAFTPTIDFSPLGDLGKVYREAQNRRTLADLGAGLADGSVNFQQAAGQLASTGNLNGVVSLLQLGEAQRKRDAELAAGRQADSLFSSLYGGGASTGAPMASASPSGGYGNAIASIESGGKYDALGPVTRTGDRAYGKYGIMGQNVGPWTQEVLGRAMTPEEFAASPQAQDAVFQAKFGNYVQKYGPEGAARAWFAGEGGMNDPNRRDQLGTSVSQYGQRFTAAMGGQGPGDLPTNAQPAQGVLPQAAPQGGGLSPRALGLMRALSNPNLPAGQRDMAKMLLSRELDELKTPEKIRTLQQMKAESGYQGTILDLEKELKAAGKPEVNIDQRGESEYAKQIAKQFAELNVDLIKGAQSARTKLNALGRMEVLLRNPDVYTGTAANQVLAAKKLAKSAGFDVSGVEGAEAIRAIGNQFALELRNPAGGAGMPGALSDKDREFLTQSTVNLENTPLGNQLILDYSKRVAQRSIDVERLRQQYVKRNGRLDEGFYRELEAYSEANPLFTEEDASRAQSAQGPAQPTQMAPQDIDTSLANARAAIARNPAVRDAVIKRLRENGIDPSGL